MAVMNTPASVIALGTLLAATPVALWAGMGDELARMHLEKMGGREKLEGLRAMRVEGHTFIQDKAVQVVMWAQRPNRLWVESQMDGKKFVQAYDGEHAPWQTRSEVDDGAPQPMGESDARDFIRNADFDGPLIDSEAKGYTVDFAGEEQVEGRPAYKLLVMNRRDEILFVWLDKESYLLVRRVEYRVTQGRRVAIETYYKDYRPVRGVPQPHRVETRANGRVLHVTMLDKIDTNSRVPRGIFEPPARTMTAEVKTTKEETGSDAAAEKAREAQEKTKAEGSVAAAGEKQAERPAAPAQRRGLFGWLSGSGKTAQEAAPAEKASLSETTKGEVAAIDEADAKGHAAGLENKPESPAQEPVAAPRVAQEMGEEKKADVREAPAQPSSSAADEQSAGEMKPAPPPPALVEATAAVRETAPANVEPGKNDRPGLFRRIFGFGRKQEPPKEEKAEPPQAEKQRETSAEAAKPAAELEEKKPAEEKKAEPKPDG